MKRVYYDALWAAIGLVLVMGINGCTGGRQAALPPMPATGQTCKNPVDMSGHWMMAVKTPHGSGTPSFDLIQQGDRLSGSYSGLFGNYPVTGSVSGNKFVLQYDSNGVAAKYIGQAAGCKAEGKVIYGSYGEGSFTGKKQ